MHPKANCNPHLTDSDTVQFSASAPLTFGPETSWLFVAGNMGLEDFSDISFGFILSEGATLMSEGKTDLTETYWPTASSGACY